MLALENGYQSKIEFCGYFIRNRCGFDDEISRRIKIYMYCRYISTSTIILLNLIQRCLRMKKCEGCVDEKENHTPSHHFNITS